MEWIRWRTHRWSPTYGKSGLSTTTTHFETCLLHCLEYLLINRNMIIFFVLYSSIIRTKRWKNIPPSNATNPQMVDVVEVSTPMNTLLYEYGNVSLLISTFVVFIHSFLQLLLIFPECISTHEESHRTNIPRFA